MNRPFVRIAPWILLLLVAYVLGRWHGRQTSKLELPAESSETSNTASSAAPAPVEPSRDERLNKNLEELYALARSMAAPDAHTYAFFERLEVADMPVLADLIRAMPVGNEQDLFFSMTMRRWAQLDGPAALAQAASFPALATRQNTQLVVWETWGTRDASAAMARAQQLDPGTGRDRALAAVLTGAGTTDPRLALDLWRTAPEDFRLSSIGPNALEQIVTAAYGTGRRETIQTLIGESPDDETRARLVTALCGEWGGHHPDEALSWLSATVSDTTQREAGMTRIFESLVQKDPPRAAVWGLDFPDARRRSAMIATAVANWVEVDVAEAELWINEQPDSRELDGATFAMAAHFIGSKNMPRAFAWICRIRQDEARAELLGNLGRSWSRDHPAEFRAFLDQTSLNRAERDMLVSKLEPTS